MGYLPWRQSISVCSIVEVPKFLGLLLRAELQRIVAPNPHMEREYPKTVARELPFLRQLCRESSDPHLGRRLHEPGYLLPGKRCKRNLHGSGIRAANDRNVFHDRQYQPAPSVGLTEPNGRTVLWEPVYERRCRHAALSRDATFPSAAGIQRGYCWSKLHLVSLHRYRPNGKQHRQRRPPISRSERSELLLRQLSLCGSAAKLPIDRRG